METTVPVYILAGGQSRRFGSDKARASVDGVPLIVRIAQAVQPYASRRTAIARQPGQYADLGLPTIADRLTDLGPLGGLDAALHDAADEDWLLLISCDWLEVRGAWIERLLARREPEAQVVAFKGERWQPLLGLYHRSLQPTVQQQIQRGQRAMWKLIERTTAVALPLPEDWPQVAQANTPDELHAYTRQRRSPSRPD